MRGKRWLAVKAAAVIAAGAVFPVVTGTPAQAAVVRWQLHDVNAAGGVEHSFGWPDVPSSCQPVVGDWNGNTTDTVGVACPVDDVWTWAMQNQHDDSDADAQFRWGSNACLATVGDWNGDGTTTPGLVCISGTGWRWQLSNVNGDNGVNFDFKWGSSNGCWPIVGDWNGDGTTTPGLVCPTSDNGWRWMMTNYNAESSVGPDFRWGTATNCYPQVGDWNGDGKTTPGQVCRTADNVWRWMMTNYNAESSVGPDFRWGSTSQRPIVGDWNGDGTTTVGLSTLQPPPPPVPPTAGYSLPLPRSAAPRSEYDDPHHDYAAIDIGVPTGTDAYAVVAGTVSLVSGGSCGLGVVLHSSALGADFTYCHFSAHAVSNGTTAHTGQKIGDTGSTGDATGPHLHFQIRAGGALRCPQPWLQAIYDGRTPPLPGNLPTSGCSY
jgi:hypothetical protein